MKSCLRVALVGCGVISDNHICGIIGTGKAKIVAICDIDRDRAENKKIQYGLRAEVYTDYIKMLECEDLDAVHIATPHHLHCEMTVAALERNIHVFLEKPMCINEEEIGKLIEAERNSTAKVCVCFQNRFNKTTRFARTVCDEDGGAISAYFAQFWKRDEKYYAQDKWRGKIATEGGGTMINQAIHQLDLLCFFLGKPQKLCASVANHTLKGIIEVEDSCEGLVEFQGGKRANFYATNAAAIGDYTSVILMTKNHRIELRHPDIYLDGVLVDEAKNTIPEVGKACYGEGHGYIIDGFYTSIIEDAPVPVSLEDAQYATRLVFACYKSNDNLIDI